MKLQLLKTLGLLSIAAAQAVSGAQVDRLETRWEDLEQAVSGRDVSTVLVDQTELHGRVLSVSADGVRFDVKRTSNARAYPKGEATVPRQQLSVLSYVETEGKWRGVGTAIGAGAGAAAGGMGAVRMKNEGNSSAAATVAASAIGAGAAVGYFAGRGADRRTVTVVVAK